MTTKALAVLFGGDLASRLWTDSCSRLVGGIYTADPELLSLKATMPRFLEMEQSHGSVIRATLAQQKKDRKSEQG
jgi:oxygen-dependent protoporphyrinogen oxidase